MGGLFLIAMIIWWVAHMNLKSRVANLEAFIESQSAHKAQTSVPAPVAQAIPTESVPLVAPTFIPQAVAPSVSSTEADLGSEFIQWLQRDWLMKIGALFLLMGLGWFVSYAIANNLIGPAGRIVLGLVMGAGVLILGAWRIRTREHQGAIFTVLGSTIILMTVSAGHFLYSFFTPFSALALICLSVLFVAFVSIQYNRNSLALASLILSALAPYFSDIPDQGLMVHFTYLLVVVLGTLWVVYITGWRNLTLTALLIVFLMTGPYMAEYDERSLALLWSFIFTGIFFVANIISLIRQRGGITSETNLYTALGTALFLVLWVFGVAEEELRSLLLVAWTLVFAVGAYLVYRSTDVRSPFYVYGGTGIALLFAATYAELDGAVLTILLTFETAVLVLAASFLNMGSAVVRSLSLLFVLPALLSFESITSNAWRMGVLHEDFFNLLVLTLVFAIVGLFVKERHEHDTQGTDMKTGGLLVIVASLYAIILIWLVLHGAFPNADDFATTLTLITYTIIGIGAYVTGIKNGIHDLRVWGGVLLGFVACRLLIVDVWGMDPVGKVVTFFAIGILMLSTAFMGRGQKQHTLPQQN